MNITSKLLSEKFQVMQPTYLDLAAFDARHCSCDRRYNNFDGEKVENADWNWKIPHSKQPVAGGWSKRAHRDCPNSVLGFGYDASHINLLTNIRIWRRCLDSIENAVDLMCRDWTHENRSYAVPMDSFLLKFIYQNYFRKLDLPNKRTKNISILRHNVCE